jgi:glycine cleavage system transcriptional repressor
MRTNIVISVTGADRVGVVEEVTKVLLDLGGNVETSRMARLGGEFAMLMLVSFSADAGRGIEAAVADLTARGYKVTASETAQTYAESHAGWRAYHLSIEGADHEGIMHEIAAGLSARGISIESMDTSVAPASVSGALLFSLTATVVVPPELDEFEWLTGLDEAGTLANVDVKVTAL